MWLKEEGFKEMLKDWWQGFNFSGSYSFILTKIKGFKKQFEDLKQGSVWKSGGEQEAGSRQSVVLG